MVRQSSPRSAGAKRSAVSRTLNHRNPNLPPLVQRRQSRRLTRRAQRVPLWNSSSSKPSNTEKDDGSSSAESVTVREKQDGEILTSPSSTTNSSQEATLHLEPVPSKNALIVKIQPPVEPSTKIAHVPSDIVLVIDVSGSMAMAAPVPGEDPSENTGLSVLDLTKHAARTIIETMNEGDRLGIVTFSGKAKVVQPLIPMTDANKEVARKNVTKMEPQDATNLWHGILEGLKLFKNIGSSAKVPAVMILTDGMPNHMCPPAGYVPKIRAMGQLPASLHTFGFGYSLRSGLLKSIAEIGGGNYAFIPDAGMIGTVFVHAVANLQSTFAIKAELKLRYSTPLELVETMGESVEQQGAQAVEELPDTTELTIPLGNLQYGQSRDIFLRVKNVSDALNPVVSASIAYFKPSHRSRQSIAGAIFSRSQPLVAALPVTSASCSVLDNGSLSEAEIAYHDSRSLIGSFISSIFPIGTDGEHRPNSSILTEKREELEQLVQSLPAKPFLDAQNMSLMQDITNVEPQGQVCLAISTDAFFLKWGGHFLPSLLNAHTRQVCNSFKDPGALQYGTGSPLFKSCRDTLDKAFDDLPAPEPSRPARGAHYGSHGGGSSMNKSYAPIHMSRYNTSSGVCFAGSTGVTLASGRSVEIRKLRRGMKVRTPMGSRRVAMVLRTPVQSEVLCRIGKVLVTPWHPISTDGKAWAFPANEADGAVLYTGSIYSILLERSRSSQSHAIRVGNVWGVTLGHGLTSGSDSRAHAFFGDYNAVGKSLVTLERRRKGVVIGGGVERDEATGLVKGFMRRQKESTESA
ncbi:hint-domain-containing protein [Dactylonectria estremocensis]|uniref:Hint-domain-containing protein n=1 Tax=Dactylonectria estremocensis TaxID=1079267 RepID=A0A9P9FBG7_9HYPO|nr:hint-domain-containing protein [Dactylonectria estremocensis]